MKVLELKRQVTVGIYAHRVTLKFLPKYKLFKDKKQKVDPL